MKYLLHLPPVVQAPAIVMDEFYFHFARAGPIAWLAQFQGLEFALPVQAVVLALHMIYQAMDWNLVWKAQAAQFEAGQ